MTDEIRIISIELENYRQYYGKHTIQFSSRDEGFTIIAGKNGEGKSNLLNSISWCLYHDEPHGKKSMQAGGSEQKSLSVINNRYITELGEEKTAKTSVKIQISRGDDTYSISRVLTVIKHKLEFTELAGGGKSLLVTEYSKDRVPRGCEIINENQNDFVIKKKSSTDMDFHDTIKQGDPNTIMEEILPQGLSKYFLLDGEFLEGIWKDPKIIQEGIEQISQLHLLSSLMKHVDEMRIPPKGAGKDTDELTNKIQTLVWYEKSLDSDGNEKFSDELRWKLNPDEGDAYYHATGSPRIKDLNDDMKKMQDRIHAISSMIPNINIPSLALLKDRYEELETQIEDEKNNLDSAGKKYLYNLITKSSYVFLKEAIEDSVKIIEDRMNLGDLPIRQRRQFADDLLKRGKCICGEELHSQNTNHAVDTRRASLENFRDNLTGKDDLDAGVDMKYDFKHDFIDKYDEFLKFNFGDPRTKFTESEVKYKSLNKELKGIQTRLKDSGNDEIKSLIDEQVYLQEQIGIISNEKILKIKLQLASDAKIQSNLKIQLEKGLKKNKKAKRMSHELEVWKNVFTHIKTVYNDLNTEIRNGVQNNTWKNFRDLLANPNEFKSFEIEPDYSIHLLDQHDINKIRDLSAGQGLILTLAFVAALREPTGYKFPIVVDSPLGKIDSANRHNIGKHLPEYLPKEQLILLVIDTEYAAYLPPDSDYPDLPNTPIGKLLEEKIPLKHLKIQKEKQGENTGNSEIKPAKLVFDEARKGWMVKAIV